MEDVSEIKPDKDVVKESEVGHVGNWAFSDHSYSVPTRIYHDSHFVEHTADAFLADHCDDKNLCLEVAANEVLDVQGTGPPPQDCILDYCLETKTEVGDDNSEIKDSIESLPDDQDSKPPCSKPVNVIFFLYFVYGIL